MLDIFKMSNYTYLEAITHVRKYKAFFKLEAIAKAININADQFRQIVSRRNRTKELPEKYRAEFVKVVMELCQVEQVERFDGGTEALNELFRNKDMMGEPF